MARRAQSKLPIGTLIGALALVLLVGFVGFKFLGRSETQTYSSLNIEEFRQNSISMRGNRYQLEGRVARRDRVTNSGQIIELTVTHEGRNEPIQVFIPSDIPNQNIEVGYNLKFVVEIDQYGWPRAISFQRS